MLPVAVTVVVTMEALRILFPEIYGVKDRAGMTAALVGVAFAALGPLVAPILMRVLGHGRAATVVLSALALWRLGVQVIGSIPTVLAVVGAVLAFAALSLLLSVPVTGAGDGRGLGFVAGLGIDAVVLASFATWDPVFQQRPSTLIVGLAIVAGLVWSAAWAARPGRFDDASARWSPSVVGGVAIGAVLALEVLFLANVGYVAASVGIGLTTATAIAVAGLVLAGAGLITSPSAGRPMAFGAVAVLIAAGYLLPVIDGWIVVPIVLVAQVAVGLVLASALATRTGPLRSAIGLTIGWALAVAAILLFLSHYDRPMAIDNRFVTAALGLVTLLAVVRPSGATTGDGASIGWRWAAVLAGATVAGLLTATIVVTAPEPAPVSGPTWPLQVVQWNIRQAVDQDGKVDPEAIADGLEARGVVDIVVLNEAARGWPLSGQLDLAEWLARRLDMHSAWAGAASQQFGTVLLSRHPIESADVVVLPTAGRSQGRSLLHAVLDVGDGTTVDVLATHLQHRNDPESMAARMEEIEIVIDEWGGAPATILAGDLNPAQGDPPDYPPRVPGEFAEIAALLDAGFTTATDLAACSSPTSGSNCSDYILVSPDLVQPEYLVGEYFGDHRMVVSTVAPAAAG